MIDLIDFYEALKAIQSGQAIIGKGRIFAPLLE